MGEHLHLLTFALRIFRISCDLLRLASFASPLPHFLLAGLIPPLSSHRLSHHTSSLIRHITHSHSFLVALSPHLLLLSCCISHCSLTASLIALSLHLSLLSRRISHCSLATSLIALSPHLLLLSRHISHCSLTASLVASPPRVNLVDSLRSNLRKSRSALPGFFEVYLRKAWWINEVTLRRSTIIYPHDSPSVSSFSANPN